MLRRALSLAAAVLSFFAAFPNLAASQAFAGTQAPRVIRVGFPQQTGLTQVDENGSYSGYTYDYLQEIAQFTGWEYSLVQVPGNLDYSLQTMLDMLEQGELDIVGGLMKTPESAQLYGFPEYSYGTSYTTLNVRDENTAINETNYQTLSGLRVAVIATANKRINAFKEFCSLNHITYTLVECAGQKEQEEALKDGRADAALGVDLVKIPETRIVAKFNGTPYYLASTKGNAAILNALNASIASIERIKPYFTASLYEKYFDFRSGKTYLNEEEKAFVKTAPPLRVAVVPGAMPIQDLNGKGRITGVAGDIYARITRDTGLAFTYLEAASYEEAYRMLREGEADAVSGLPYDYDLAMRQGLLLTSPYLSAPMVMTTKSGDEQAGLAGKRVGVVNGYALPLSGLQELQSFDTAEQIMDAILGGDIDCAVTNMYAAEYLVHRNKYRNLRLIPQAGQLREFCLALQKPVDLTLVSLINKAVTNVSDDDLTAMLLQNTAAYQPPATLSSIIEENPILSMLAVAALFVVLLLSGLLLLRQRLRASRRIKMEHQRYLQLSDLANEYIYEYDRVGDRVTFSKSFAEAFGTPDYIDRFSACVRERSKPGGTLAENAYQQILAPGRRGIDNEQVYTLPDGSSRWFRNIWADIAGPGGETVYTLGKLIDIQQEREERNALVETSRKDGLTGIYNAAFCRQELGRRLRELRGAAALLIIDVDHFKTVNDTLGHYMGDVLLKDFARQLAALFRNNDVVGRLGGDEFLVYMDPVDSLENVETRCKSLCAAARKTYRSDGYSHEVTISVGAVVTRGACPFDALYQQADSALYQAKGGGRNRYVILDRESAAP